MKKVNFSFVTLTVFVAIFVLIGAYFIYTSFAANPRGNTVQVTVTCNNSDCPLEDDIWVYLYKADNVKGKNYDEVKKVSQSGVVTFERVPAQEMMTMISVSDYQTSPEGYRTFEGHQFTKPMFTVKPGLNEINWPISY